MSDWNSEQYMKFGSERTQPSADLINRINIEPATILDIGCGPGNSTDLLFRRFSGADILGIDSSVNMLERAKKSYSNLSFRKCIVPDGLDELGQYDLIFSNACLHWIPNHDTLLPKLIDKLNQGGMLAVQMPLVQYAQFYRTLDKLLTENKWSCLRDIKNFHNLLPDETYDILSAVSHNITMWDTEYYHIVDSHDAVIEWYRGSGLRPYLERLGPQQEELFIEELRTEISRTFPVRADGKVILKMPRLFFTVQK